MIENVWQGPRSDALLADWRQVPLPARSIDLAYCDGGFHLLDFPDGQTKLCAEIERLLDQDGRFITRLFTPPTVKQTPEQVLDDLMAGRIPSLNHLKPRLWMALQETAEAGISVGQVWEWLHALAPNWSELAAKLGWPVEHLSAIDSYRGSSARYHCVTLEQVEAMFCDAHGFDRHQLYVPDYDMGDWFPTLVLRRT
jgi:SAM-dependent methyltransferase